MKHTPPIRRLFALMLPCGLALAITPLISAESDKPAPPRDSGVETAPAPKEPSGDAKPKDANKPAKEKRTYLGVITTQVPPSLGEHLELPIGFGIQVQEVVPDSPAAKSGLKANDILTKFGDQRLIGPEHLSLLVRGQKAEDKVELTIIRKGTEEKLAVTLGATDELLSGFGPMHGDSRWMGGHDPEMMRHWQESMQRHQDAIRDNMEHHQEAVRRNMEHRPEGNKDRADQKPEAGRDEAKGPEASHEGRPDAPHPPKPDNMPQTPKTEGARGDNPPGGRPPAVSVRPGFPVNIFGTEGVIKIDNEQGEMTITHRQGEHRIEIKDQAGATVHTGPFEPGKGIAALPEKAREQLSKMKLEDLEVFAPKDAAPPERTAAPAPPRAPESAAGPDTDVL
jgi:PDZ domain